MKSSIISYVGWLLILSALGFYVYGISHAIYLSWPYDAKNPGSTIIPFWPELATTLSSIQSLFLINLGVILGIAIKNPASGIARSIMLNRSAKAMIDPPPSPMELREKVQLLAIVIYLLALIACLITYIHNDFSSSPMEVVGVVAESGKMFLGVVLAYLTAALGNTTNNS